MDTRHSFNNHFAPDSFRCKCGAETDRRDRERREQEECPARVREEAERLATDPLGAKALARSIAAQERNLEADRAKLRNLQATCQHDWEEPKYTPKVREAYRTQDLHGHFIQRTDGTIDAPTVTVLREEIPLWSRTCRRCDKTETTNKTTEKVTRAPSF